MSHINSANRHSQSASGSQDDDFVMEDVNQQGPAQPVTVFKGAKRKRLIKACDACHKSKRRCDGAAPCGNCYFASKECRYTDATGRVVPAPNAALSTRPASETAGPSNTPQASSSGSGSGRRRQDMYANSDRVEPRKSDSSSSHRVLADEAIPRKRLRWDHDPRGFPVDPSLAQFGSTPDDADYPPGVDKLLRHELVNLFIAHCHPHRFLIHIPTFRAQFDVERAPPYLVNAIGSVAAPLCRNPRLPQATPLYAGRPFADVAYAQLFDEVGKLRVEHCLAAAQALVILQMHEATTNRSFEISGVLLNVASHLLDALGVRTPFTPLATPLPSEELTKAAVELECLRRTYWTIRFLDILAPVYAEGPNPMSSKYPELPICLPCSEAAFEATTHSFAPEFLHVPAPDTYLASEFGHVIRVTGIISQIQTLNMNHARDPRSVVECERHLNCWYHRLSQPLKYTEENVKYRLSMWETMSNTGTWCFFFMHIVHACCILLINDIHHYFHRDAMQQWALNRIALILSSLGSRARNSLIMSIVLRVRYITLHAPIRHSLDHVSQTIQSLVTENQPEVEPQVKAWLEDFEELWSGQPNAVPQDDYIYDPTPLAVGFPPTDQLQPAMLPSISAFLPESIDEMQLQALEKSPFAERPSSRRWSHADFQQWRRTLFMDPPLPSEEMSPARDPPPPTFLRPLASSGDQLPPPRQTPPTQLLASLQPSGGQMPSPLTLLSMRQGPQSQYPRPLMSSGVQIPSQREIAETPSLPSLRSSGLLETGLLPQDAPAPARIPPPTSPHDPYRINYEYPPGIFPQSPYDSGNSSGDYHWSTRDSNNR